MSIPRTAVFLLVAALTAGCVDQPVGSAPPSPTSAPEPTPISTTVELGTKVWYEGLVVTFDRVTSLLDVRGGTVSLLVAVANPSNDPVQLDGGISLAIGDLHVEATRDSAIPEVPGNGSVATVLMFELQSIASIDDAAFELGRAPDHVARVPVTPAAGKAVTFEPQAFELKGSTQASSLKIALKSGLLRWDLPDWTQELNANLQVLTVTYEVTYAGDFAGGLAFTGDNVALKLPDGTVVSARQDGHSQSVELVGAHKTKKGMFTRFEIPSGLTGTFTFLVRSSGVEKAIKLTIGD